MDIEGFVMFVAAIYCYAHLLKDTLIFIKSAGANKITVNYNVFPNSIIDYKYSRYIFNPQAFK